MSPDPIVPPAAPAPEVIAPFRVQIATFVNEQGHKIEQRVCVKGTLPPRYPAFMGFAVLAADDGTGLTEYSLHFAIMAPDVDTAFEKFPRMRDLAKEKKMAELNAPMRPQAPAIAVVDKFGNSMRGPGGVPLSGG